jgi:hypothetical protein
MFYFNLYGGRLSRDRMVVGFTTTYAISSYHHWCCVFECRPWRGVQHCVIKFVSDLRQVGGLPNPPVSSTNKTDRHDISEILLKVALSTIKQTNKLQSVCNYNSKHLLPNLIYEVDDVHFVSTLKSDYM